MNVGDALGSIPGIGGPLKSFFNTVGGSIHNFGNRILNVQGYFDQARAQGLNPFKAAVHALGKEFPVLGAAMTAFGQVWPTMWEGLWDIGSTLARAFSGVVEIIKGFFNLIKGPDPDDDGRLRCRWETIKHGASQLWDGVLNIFGAALSLLSMAVDGIGVIFSTVFSGSATSSMALPEIPAFAGVFELIGEKGEDDRGVIQDVFGVIAALMRGDWSDAWDHFKRASPPGIADLVFTGPELFIELITGTDWDAVTNGLSNWGDKLSELGADRMGRQPTAQGAGSDPEGDCRLGQGPRQGMGKSKSWPEIGAMSIGTRSPSHSRPSTTSLGIWGRSKTSSAATGTKVSWEDIPRSRWSRRGCQGPPRRHGT